MELNGRSCYLGSLESRNIRQEDIDAVPPEKLVKGINHYAGRKLPRLKEM